MKDYKLYTKISIIYIGIFLVLSYGIVFLLLKNYIVTLIEGSLKQLQHQTEMLKRVQLKVNGVDKSFDDVLLIQNIIEDSQMQLNFVSVLNWAGNYVCYPEIFRVGEKPDSNNVFENETVDAVKVYSKFFSTPTLLEPDAGDSPIISLSPINKSDFIIANHLNLKEIKMMAQQKRYYFTSILAVMGLILWLVTLWVCRFLSNHFNRQIEARVEVLSMNAKSIKDINASLEKYQENLKNMGNSQETKLPEIIDKDTEEFTKERILTYVRNELLPISITSIAYVYVENTITYIVTKQGKKSTTPDPLDKIYSMLNEKEFFKVNRQFIVSIEAISKITKFENSKLKLQVTPPSELDVIIGKNKVSLFKQWLDL
ncbi:LytR/AlgR family response regulator transcription factor [Aquimarina agarivorans]|uniref:LytR/AlgR family response regulator transcription factor n=1 Tax=Aquimarina agarivorans TaxID=980584 RepID=UPI000248F287|nr:LytTR family DNA-binding domain-containing protein [Aquimarina agarivorans]